MRGEAATRLSTLAIAIALIATRWCMPSSAAAASDSVCASLHAKLQAAARSRHDVETALAAHTDLADIAAFDSLQHELDEAAPFVSQCIADASDDASLEFARDRLLFDYAPPIPAADPACATVPANPTTVDERRQVAQCEYGSQMIDVAKAQLYVEHRALLAKLQSQFDTLTTNDYAHTSAAEYAADRAFLASARTHVSAEAVALPSSAPAALPTSRP